MIRHALLPVTTAIILVACKPPAHQGVNLNHGAGIYFEKCATCHGPDGTPTTPTYPPLRESEWLRVHAAPLIAIVLDGATGNFEVGGKTYRGVMPAWRDVLDDAQIAAVLSFIRTEFGDGASPVSAGDVAALRERTKDRRKFWTQEELRAFAAQPPH